jgi:predicted DNA binding CopG/RHH family protein
MNADLTFHRSGTGDGPDPKSNNHTGEHKMRKEYDFSAAKRNPYVKRLKKAVTIRLEPDVIHYFKALSSDNGIPYQNLINLYLLDCAKEQRRLALTWKK